MKPVEEKIKPIGAAMLGKGYWGSILKRYFGQDPRFTLLHNGGKSYPKEVIWHDKSVDLVIIATPNETHFDLICQALKSGKNIFVEKPLALTDSEVQYIRELSKKVDKFVVTDYTQTFSPGLNFLAKQVKSKIGGIIFYHLKISRRLNPPVSQSENAYWTLTSHLLSTLSMFEDLDQLHFQASKDKHNPAGIVTSCLVKFERGYLSANIDSPHKETTLTINGENGYITYQAFVKPTINLKYTDRSKSSGNPSIIDISKNFDEQNNLTYVIDYLWEVYNRTKPSNLETAIKITQILDSIQR